MQLSSQKRSGISKIATFLRHFLKIIVDVSLVQLVNYIDSRRAKPKPTNVINLIEAKAVSDSAEYAEKHMAEALYFPSREQLWDYAISKITLDSLYVEFGVYRGVSINFFANRLPHKKFYGFDSFEGLKEDWTGANLRKGHFDVKGRLPHVLPNVELISGWFDETIASFIVQHPDSFAFIHFDADTYESTALILDLLSDRMKPGTVIIFDQYFGYRGWKLGEWKAWQDFSKSRNCTYRYLGFSAHQVALLVM